HVLVLCQGLLNLEDQRVLPASAFAGLRDTARLLLDAARGPGRRGGGGGGGGAQAGNGAPPLATEALRRIERFDADLHAPPNTLTAATLLLQRLAVAAGEIAAGAAGAAAGHANDEVRWWAAALERECVDHRDDLAR